MDESHLWKIIAPMRGRTRDAREAALFKELKKLKPEELVEFDRIYHETLRDAYSWDLWGAGYVIICGCSDDAFTEFCNWLISEGQSAFESALTDPDSIADRSKIPMEDGRPWPMLPEADLIAGRLYSEKTSREMEFHSGILEAPKGEKWAQDPEVLKKRFPRTWKRFGGRH